MKWVVLTAMLFVTGCATGLGGDAACEATRDQRTALAGALLDDGGDQSQREGLELISVLDAVCVDS